MRGGTERLMSLVSLDRVPSFRNAQYDRQLFSSGCARRNVSPSWDIPKGTTWNLDVDRVRGLTSPSTSAFNSERTSASERVALRLLKWGLTLHLDTRSTLSWLQCARAAWLFVIRY
jgi:hypothetical protein